ncbi:phosphotransferase family protein [Williamsia sp. M5A3_1d]
MTVDLVTDVDAITPHWLSDVFGASVQTVTTERIGTGQIASCHRITMTGPGVDAGVVPPSVVAKLPAADPAAREMIAGAYAAEVRFYAHLADTVEITVPACHLAIMNDTGSEFTLLLADLYAHHQGDQIAGCSRAAALIAVRNLAGLHGPRWCDPTLLTPTSPDVPALTVNGPAEASMLAELYPSTVDLFLEAVGEQLTAADIDTLREVGDVIERWSLARSERFALIHGDHRLDNLMFDAADTEVLAVDWQTVGIGLPARDLAFFVGTALDPGPRRAAEADLVDAYHRALMGHGVAAHDRDECWDDYRFAMIQGPLVAVFGCAYGTRSPRGDAMFATMVRRSCAAIRELGTVGLARGA